MIVSSLMLLAAAVRVYSLDRQSAFVELALSGDTVRLRGGKNLKYIGLEAPPTQSSIELLKEYGLNALKFNQSLVEGKEIQIEWGSQIRDDRNNFLAYVFLSDGTFVNETLLRSGNGKARISTPNLKYAKLLRKAELEARRDKKGLWIKEPDNPYLVSEYIGEKNTKIFYFPTSPELDHIPEANLVTFRSRVEAKAAGYRACSACREDQSQPY